MAEFVPAHERGGAGLMARLDRKQAEDFAEALILKKAQQFFAELDEGQAIDDHAREKDVDIDAEDWDLIKDLINTGQVALLPWGGEW